MLQPAFFVNGLVIFSRWHSISEMHLGALKTRDHAAGVENVGLENPGSHCKAGKRGTGKHGNELVWN